MEGRLLSLSKVFLFFEASNLLAKSLYEISVDESLGITEREAALELAHPLCTFVNGQEAPRWQLMPLLGELFGDNGTELLGLARVASELKKKLFTEQASKRKL